MRFILILLFSLMLAPARAQDAPLHLTEARWLTTQSRSYSAPSAAQDSAALPGTWQAIQLPSALPSVAGDAGTIHTTWVKLPVPPSAAGNDLQAVYSARIKVEGTLAIYINGRLTHRAQLNGQLWDSLFTPLWLTMDAGPNAAPVREILIRLEHPSSSRVAVSSLWFGRADSLQSRYHTRQWLQRELPSTLNAAFVIVGVFSLAVWLRRRQEYEYLLFFGIAVTSYAGHLHYYLSLPIRDDWFGWLTANALFWLVTVLHLFLRNLHGRPLSWMTRTIVGVTLAASVASMPVLAILPIFPSTSPLVPLMYGVVVIMAAGVCLTAGVCAWRRSRDGVLLAAGLGACTLLGVPDWLLHNNVASVEGWFTGAYTNAVTFFMFGALMYRRYIGAMREVEDINASLEQRLQNRESELEVIHRQLREAAQRQTISDERQRLMQDMHDGLGSSLINAIRSVDKTESGAQKITQILKDCLDDLKLTIDSMEPVDADLLLLLASLRFRLEPRLEDAGIKLRWEVQELPALPWLEPSSALHILRIIQESIANILRHTRATEIRLSTARENSGVLVAVTDNGSGFDVDATLASGGGRGLRNQQRRAQSINGKVAWQSGAEGTRFSLWLPQAGV
jgi:signal transduction histidine kinase